MDSAQSSDLAPFFEYRKVKNFLRLSHFYNLSFFVDILKGNSQPINTCKICKHISTQIMSSSIYGQNFQLLIYASAVLCSAVYFFFQNQKLTQKYFGQMSHVHTLGLL